jgi:hypothetical protein
MTRNSSNQSTALGTTWLHKKRQHPWNDDRCSTVHPAIFPDAPLHAQLGLPETKLEKRCHLLLFLVPQLMGPKEIAQPFALTEFPSMKKTSYFYHILKSNF